MGKRELVALLNLSSWCLVMVERLFLAMTLGCLRFETVVFPDHTHLLFLQGTRRKKKLKESKDINKHLTSRTIGTLIPKLDNYTAKILDNKTECTLKMAQVGWWNLVSQVEP